MIPQGRFTVRLVMETVRPDAFQQITKTGDENVFFQIDRRRRIEILHRRRALNDIGHLLDHHAFRLEDFQ